MKNTVKAHTILLAALATTMALIYGMVWLFINHQEIVFYTIGVLMLAGCYVLGANGVKDWLDKKNNGLNV